MWSDIARWVTSSALHFRGRHTDTRSVRASMRFPLMPGVYEQMTAHPFPRRYSFHCCRWQCCIIPFSYVFFYVVILFPVYFYFVALLQATSCILGISCHLLQSAHCPALGCLTNQNEISVKYIDEYIYLRTALQAHRLQLL